MQNTVRFVTAHLKEVPDDLYAFSRGTKLIPREKAYSTKIVDFEQERSQQFYGAVDTTEWSGCGTYAAVFLL